MIATYRLQLGPSLDLEGARALVPYLRELGVSHLYLSPVMRAREGSTHGYDVVDPREVSPTLGGEAALERLAAAGLPIVLDIVPNHMAVDDDNPFWRDQALRRRVFDIDPETGRHRRFFDVDHLAGVRVEDPWVFATTHATLERLVGREIVRGLRVDHVDGLADPAEYLERLSGLGAPIWVEKILEDDERLPAWPVAGTTGYDLLADALSPFVDPSAEPEMTALWTEISGDHRTFGEVAREARREQAEGALAPEIGRLARLLDVSDMAGAAAALEVYRTYSVPARGELTSQDRRVIADSALPERLRAALAQRERGHDALVRLFQQTTPGVTAKGNEDTALYRHLRLTALNEVGCDPDRFGASIADTHARLGRVAVTWPRTLAATTTHDTKRSADARARIAALTSAPAEWTRLVREWRSAHTDLHEPGRGPDPVEEYLVYQTLVAAWPIGADRLEPYLTKALREAKRNTAWVDGDEAWEQEVLAFCRRLLARPQFVVSLEALLADTRAAARRAALGQTLIKLTAAGVPDIYQGDEDWLLALVDPDNRRPVDWTALRERLALVGGTRPLTPDLAKIGLVHRALMLRRRRPESFAGRYRPLRAGPGVLAYARGAEVIAVVPVRPNGVGARVDLAPDLTGRWRNLLTGASWQLAGWTPVAQLLGPLEVALLERW